MKTEHTFTITKDQALGRFRPLIKAIHESNTGHACRGVIARPGSLRRVLPKLCIFGNDILESACGYTIADNKIHLHKRGRAGYGWAVIILPDPELAAFTLGYYSKEHMMKAWEVSDRHAKVIENIPVDIDPDKSSYLITNEVLIYRRQLRKLAKRYRPDCQFLPPLPSTALSKKKIYIPKRIIDQPIIQGKGANPIKGAIEYLNERNIINILEFEEADQYLLDAVCQAIPWANDGRKTSVVYREGTHQDRSSIVFDDANDFWTACNLSLRGVTGSQYEQRQNTQKLVRKAFRFGERAILARQWFTAKWKNGVAEVGYVDTIPWTIVDQGRKGEMNFTTKKIQKTDWITLTFLTHIWQCIMDLKAKGSTGYLQIPMGLRQKIIELGGATTSMATMIYPLIFYLLRTQLDTVDFLKLSRYIFRSTFDEDDNSIKRITLLNDYIEEARAILSRMRSEGIHVPTIEDISRSNKIITIDRTPPIDRRLF